MMDEYIKRGDVLKHQRKMSGSDWGGDFWDYAVLSEDIKKIPTADVAEVRHGEWVTEEEDIIWGNALKRKYCSECGGRPHWNNDKREFILATYCHHCGAKMDGKRKDGAE